MLGVQSLLPNSENGSKGVLMLQATSIHGDGDKIALPPSVLDTLSQSLMESMDSDTINTQNQQEQQPWTFRVGLLNPQYSFPASPLLQNLPRGEGEEDDDEDDHDGAGRASAYLDELQHKYLSYTHATVVEFTQDEGYVGLPHTIAEVLLRERDGAGRVDTFRTMDKAVAQSLDDDAMNVEEHDNTNTPGHLAWGAFDLPTPLVEITRVRLPKGRACTLQPTTAAIQAGFYNLKDVKLVLEQSLIRTRATLSVGDVVSTWHRGTQFDLTVTNVTPATYHAVSCINTDIEIDFEAPDESNGTIGQTTGQDVASIAQPIPNAVPVGRRLNDPPLAQPSDTTTASSTMPTAPLGKATPLSLLPEPPVEQADGVVAVQVRGAGVAARNQRRFDVAIATVNATDGSTGSFQLVTRFPRRVLTLNEAAQTLAEAGVSAGQELFLIEQ
jgi:Ubiquitin fusion degradation protein UFD1